MVDIANILNENLIQLNMQARTKEEAIQELTECLYKEGYVSNPAVFIQDVYLRESEGKTGLGQHIAIPHGKSDAVQVTSLAFGRTENKLAWETPDDEPVQVVILFAVRNADMATLNLKLLAQVAMALADDDTLARLLVTKDKSEVIRLLSQRM